MAFGDTGPNEHRFSGNLIQSEDTDERSLPALMTVSRGSVVVVSLDQTVTWGPYPLDTLAVSTKSRGCYSLVGGRGDRATFCLQGDVEMFERLLGVDDESPAVWFRRNMSPLMDPQLRALIPDAPALLSELLQHRWADESDNLISKPSRYVRATPLGMVYLDCLLVVTDDLLGLFGLVPGRGYSFFGFGAPSPVPLSSLARVRYGRVNSARSPNGCSILGLTLDGGATVFVETNVVGHLSRDPDVEDLRKRASALRRLAGLPRVARWLGGPPIRIPSPGKEALADAERRLGGESYRVPVVTCPKCRQQVAATLKACWNCQTPLP